VWKDASFVFKGAGTKEKPICLAAETPGKVILAGESSLALSGNWLRVSGLLFTNGRSPKEAVISFRTSPTDYAYNSTVAQCAVVDFSKSYKDSVDHWVELWGKNNVLEYCYFEGKTNEGPTLVVYPNDANSIENHHVIHHNYFGKRPRLGSNGGETMRLGTSDVCTNSCQTTVISNYFEHCCGEVEIISNKSSDNKFINNTFFECEGSLVLRHGNNAVVSGNWFIGNDKPYSGGVRIINAGHLIFNNFFYKLRGKEFRAPLAIMNAIPNSPPSGYAAVKNVQISNNTFYDCTPLEFCAGTGFRNRIVTPESTLFINNIVCNPTSSNLIIAYDKTDGITMHNNLMIDSSGTLQKEGMISGQIEKSTIGNQEIILSSAKAKKMPFVKMDILGQQRDEAVVGAFQSKNENSPIEIASAATCGPSWYKPSAESKTGKIGSGKLIPVAAGGDNLYQSVRKAKSGDILELEPGDYILTKSISIDKTISIRAKDRTQKPRLKMQLNKDNISMFVINKNNTLSLSDIAIDGDSKAKFPVKYAFTSAKNDALGYSLFVDNCDIYDINVESGAIYKAYKGTFADTIKFSNSTLKNCYRGFTLADEKDDIGKYGADFIVLDNCVFSNITQYIIDYYRGGNDESTLGGSLTINHCVFDQIAMNEKQSILKLTNIVNVSITNTIFNNSLAKVTVKLSGVTNSMKNCCIYNCATPKAENGATVEKIVSEKPSFEPKSFILSQRSSLRGKGTGGTNIGLKQ